jgi:hypothetical protein
MIGHGYGQTRMQPLYDGLGNPIGLRAPGRPSAPVVQQQMLYDGLGNPIGLFPFIPAIASIAAKVLPSLVTKATSILPGLLPSLSPTRATPLPAPTVPSPVVRFETSAPPPVPFVRPLRRIPTMEECRRLYPMPPPPMPPPPIPVRRRRPRIVRIR